MSAEKEEEGGRGTRKQEMKQNSRKGDVRERQSGAHGKTADNRDKERNKAVKGLKKIRNKTLLQLHFQANDEIEL